MYIPGDYFSDPQAFLFTLVNTYNSSGKYPILDNRQAEAVYDSSFSLVVFGDNYLCSENCNQNTNNLSYVQDTNYATTAKGNKNTVYNGGRNFLCQEVEVYATIKMDQYKTYLF